VTAGEPLRLLHFTDSLEPSGVGEHVYLLARELAVLGYRQALVCPETPAGRSLLERCAALGMEVYPWRVRSEDDARDYKRLVRLLGTRRFDLVHNHIGITWEGCWGTFAAAEAGVPVLCTEHLPYLITDPAERALKLQASRRVAGTIAVSHGVAETLLAQRLVRPDCVHVVWNGIDLARFPGERRPERRCALLGIDRDQALVVCVARLTPQKGHATLLQAVARLRRTRPGVVVALAGDGPLQAELQQMAAALGLAGAVRFLGRYPDVPALLSCADVLVQPSTFEGLPLAVLEGMAAALPVIVTDTIGNRETVVHNQSGLIVPPNDAEALAAALERVLSNPALAAQLGRQARRRVECEFVAPVMARRTHGVYRRTLQAVRAAA
jgi:glycosyltransferase involved in cell wall biosynthesis